MSGRVLCARRGSCIHPLLGQNLRKPAPGGRRTEARKSGTTEWVAEEIFRDLYLTYFVECPSDYLLLGPILAVFGQIVKVCGSC